MPPAPARLLLEELMDFCTHLVHSISLSLVLSLVSVWALFLVWTSGDPISSPCFCRAWLFYLCVGGGIILIKVVIFLHMLAVLSVERVCPVLHFPERQDGLVQPQ